MTCSIFSIYSFLFFRILFLLPISVTEKLKNTRNFLIKSTNADLRIKKLMFGCSSKINSSFIKNLYILCILIYFLYRTRIGAGIEWLTGIFEIWQILAICTAEY